MAAPPPAASFAEKADLMSNTFKHSAVHTVFAPKYRRALIITDIRENVQRYITGKVNGLGHHLIAIYAMPDHVHMLMAISMNMMPAKIMQVVKGETSKWINENGWLPREFKWQRGYGWFHVGHEDVDRLVQYIHGQPEHHRQQTFLQEFEWMMRQHGIDYDPRFGFQEPED